MAYQSEAALEQQFIEQLNKQEYSTVDIPDYDALVENFKIRFEAFNAPKLDTPITDKEWERIFKQKEKHTRDLVFGLLDCSLIMFLFLPFFGQKGDEIIKEVSLLSLTGTPQYIKIPYLIIVFGIVLTGVLLLALQNYEAVFWLKHKHQISIVLSTVATIEFMITLQPYAAFFTFVFLAIKSLMLIKWR